MKSIMQDKKECYLCRIGNPYMILPEKGLHRHHVMFGTADRKLSEKYGLWVYLCYYHHNDPQGENPHFSREVNVFLRKNAQKAFLKNHPAKEWMRVFGKNYLESPISSLRTDNSEAARKEEMRDSGIKSGKNGINAFSGGFWFIDEEEEGGSGGGQKQDHA